MATVLNYPDGLIIADDTGPAFGVSGGAAAGRLLDDGGGLVNVAHPDHGAVAVTVSPGYDSSPAFASAIARAAARGGGTVLVPAGTYNVPGGIALASGVSLQGDGIGRTIIDFGGADRDGMVGADVQDLSVRDLTVRGITGVGSTERTTLLLIGEIRNVHLARVRADDGDDAGIKVTRHSVTGARPNGVILEDCVAVGSKRGSGIEIQRGDHVHLRGCAAGECSQHGFRFIGGMGLRVWAPVAWDCGDQNFYFGGSGDNGVDVAESLEDWEIHGFYSYATGNGAYTPVTGLSIRDGASRGAVHGGTVEGGGRMGVGVYFINAPGLTGAAHGARNVTVSGTRVRGTIYGIRFARSHYGITCSNLDLYMGLHSGETNFGVFADDGGLPQRRILTENVRVHRAIGATAAIRAFDLRDANAATSHYRRSSKKIVETPTGGFIADYRGGGAGVLSETETETIPY